jgi:hypothetical protein
MYYIKESILWHADYIGRRLRDSDVMEIKAMSGRDPALALKESFVRSELCWTAFQDLEPIAMFGVGAASIMSVRGSPWMLGTDKLALAVIGIGRFSKYYVGRMKARYPILENYVDARQRTSIRWLKWCGFKMDQPEPIGINGEMFHRFYME